MADYYTLLTNAGIAYETACKAAGKAIKLTQMSVGDGGVNGVYNPDASATALKREVWRGSLNALFQDPANPNWLLAEVTIPPEVGGWYVREAGLWTDTGVLYAIIKYPESYKPAMAASGTGKEFYIRSIFETSNAALVTLSIDDTIVKATRAWVTSFVADELAKLDQKQSVRVATTANIALVGAQAIDGVAVVAGDRVLVKNQTLARENGVYVAAVGAWVRAKDADNSSKVTPNMIVSVETGAVQADTIWQLITDGAIVVGTTALTFQDVTAGFARLLSPALAGNPTAPTAALFDNSKSLATTEFVARAAGNYRGFTSLTAAATLTAAAAGTVVTTIGGFTVALPPASAMPMGGAIHFHNIGGNVVNVDCAGADSYNVGSGEHPVSIAVQPGTYLTVVSSPGQASWWAWGTAQMQYAKALGYTPPKFDNSKALATTEFVRQALGSYADSVAYQGNTSLTPADVGRLVAIGGTSAYATLPDATNLPLGSVVAVLASTTVALSVQARPGQSLVSLSSVAGPIAMAPSSMAVFRRLNDGTGWVLEGGDTALKYSPAFASSIGGAGWAKRPDGLIEQWGSGVTDANGYVYVTFPIPFPTAMRNITPVHVGGDCLMHAVMGTGISKTGCTLRVQNSTNTSSVNWQVWWRAIGN
jgi:phage-related tail fiber protein